VLGTIGTYPAHTVADDCKTIDTFRELLAKKITGIGVVDKNGKLVGNISARDIGHVVTSNPGAELNSPVGEFLSELRSAGETHDAAITCVGTDSVRAVILKIAENKIHRIYVEDGGVPIGVISLSDICRFLLKGPVDW
jgi:predicted transcriptional regulator